MKPQLADDDAAQHQEILERIRRVENATSLEAARMVGTTGEPAFQNGWQNLDTPPNARNVAFYRQGGLVFVQGVCALGTVGVVPIFTLPDGYRPAAQVAFAAVANNAFAGISVEISGAVTCFVGSNVWVFLDPISFRIAA
jgi:hypothetical protein